MADFSGSTSSSGRFSGGNSSSRFSGSGSSGSGLRDTEAGRQFAAAGRGESGQSGFGRGVLRGLLDVLNAPAYTVGNIASGNFEGAADIGLLGYYKILSGNRDDVKFERRFVSETAGARRLAELSPLPDLADELLIDIATDPLTYASFGVGGALRTATAVPTRASAALNRARTLIGRAQATPKTRSPFRELPRGLSRAPETPTQKAANDYLIQIREQLEDGALRRAKAGSRGGRSVKDPTDGITRTTPGIDRIAEEAIASGTLKAAENAAQKTLKLGIRPYFGFGRPIVLGEVDLAGARSLPFLTKSGDIVATSSKLMAKYFGSTGGATPVLAEIGQTVKRGLNAETSNWKKTIAAFDREVHKARKGTGLSHIEATEQIARYLDNPSVDLHPALHSVTARAQALKHQLDAMAIENGFDIAELPSGLPLTFGDAKTGGNYGKYMREHDGGGRISPGDAGHIDGPFIALRQPEWFSDLDTFQQFLRGHNLGKAETNISKVLDHYLDGLMRARMRRAIEDATGQVYGRLGKLEDLEFPAAPISGLFRAGDEAEAFLIRELEKRPELIGAGLDNPDVQRLLESLNLKWEKVSTRLKGQEVPAAIKHEYQEVIKAIDNLAQDTSELTTLKGVSRFMGELTNRWKALALLSPGFHVRNMLDDGFRLWFMGARDIRQFDDASMIVMGRNPDELLELGGISLTRQEWKNLMEDLGVIGTGFTAADIKPASRLRRRGPELPGTGRLARGSRDLGQIREDTMRAFGFLENIRKGAYVHDAARQVRRYMFDYGDVGRAVGAARRFFVPFLTFTAKAIPMSIRMMAMRPGFFANLEKFFRVSEELSGVDPENLPDTAANELLLPKVISDALSTPLGDDRPKVFPLSTAFTPSSLDVVPVRDSVSESADAAESEILGGLTTPIVTGPLQAISPRSYYFNRPIYPGETRDLPFGSGEIDARIEALLRTFPPYGRAQQFSDRDGGVRRSGLFSFVGPTPRPVTIEEDE